MRFRWGNLLVTVIILLSILSFRIPVFRPILEVFSLGLVVVLGYLVVVVTPRETNLRNVGIALLIGWGLVFIGEVFGVFIILDGITLMAGVYVATRKTNRVLRFLGGILAVVSVMTIPVNVWILFGERL